MLSTVAAPLTIALASNPLGLNQSLFIADTNNASPSQLAKQVPNLELNSGVKQNQKPIQLNINSNVDNKSKPELEKIFNESIGIIKSLSPDLNSTLNNSNIKFELTSNISDSVGSLADTFQDPGIRNALNGVANNPQINQQKAIKLSLPDNKGSLKHYIFINSRNFNNAPNASAEMLNVVNLQTILVNHTEEAKVTGDLLTDDYNSAVENVGKLGKYAEALSNDSNYKELAEAIVNNVLPEENSYIKLMEIQLNRNYSGKLKISSKYVLAS